MTWQIHHYEQVESTMLLAAPMPIGSAVVAGRQLSGIGRHGHSWDSPAGAGLYVSVVLRSHPVLTLALGLAAQAAILQVTSLSCDIRWPNDLMLGDKKLGGILVQMQDAQSPAARAVAGIGINIGQTVFAPDLAPIATSLTIETGLNFRRDDLLDALLPQISHWSELPSGPILDHWSTASTWARGKLVEVDMGNRILQGITDGLDSAGFLRVRKLNGDIELVVAGGVRPLSPSQL